MKSSTLIAFIISLLVQVAFPLAVTLWFRRKTLAPWRLFGYGAFVFAAFQLFTWLPFSIYMDTIVGARLSSVGAFWWLLAVALSTSLVEEGGRWLGFRYLFPRGGFRLTWRHGVMYGLGHGALEMMILFGGLTFMHLIASLVLSQLDLAAFSQMLTEESLNGATTDLYILLQSIVNTTWDYPLVVALERVSALAHQVAWSLLVMQSLMSQQKRWFGFAVLYHLSVAVIVPGLARLAGFGIAETVNLLLAGFSLWIITRLRAASPEAYSTFAPG